MDEDQGVRTLRRLRMGVAGAAVLLMGVGGSIGAAVLQEWRTLPSALLLATAGGLVLWLSRWLPSPLPGRASAAARKRAALTIVAALGCIVAGALLFRLLGNA